MKFIEKEIYRPKDDTTYRNPVITCQENRERKSLNGGVIDHLYVHGYFEGSNVKFMFCIPKKDQYQGRFYQHLSPFPGPDEELAALDKEGENDFIAFSLSYGAAYVESNMGSSAIFGNENDSSIFYKSSAAVANYFRIFVQELYGEHEVYGYVYGGSGGGYKTMSCIENTDAWNGAVPFVIGSPMSLPNCLTVYAHGGRLLRNCWPKIVDALEPGGSQNMYEGLNEEEKEALKEITLMGFPPRMCAYFAYQDDGSLPVLTPVVKMFDPTYFQDFWEKPGYLGAVNGGSAKRDRIHFTSKIISIGRPSEKNQSNNIEGRNGTDDAWQKMMSEAVDGYLELADMPLSGESFLKGVDVTIESGKAKGKKFRLGKLDGNRIIPGTTYGLDSFEDIIDHLEIGDQVRLDNSDYIAIQTYHRHQVPEDTSFYGWNQYRDEKGNPIYPQRDEIISFGFTAGGCGSVQDGKIQGKVIVINNLMDGAFPWQADWYRQKVSEVYGEQAKECFRLWYNDNCPHGDAEDVEEKLRVVSYLGMLRQALLDLSAWVEKGVEPVETSGYELVDHQVILSEDRYIRSGIQPMVKLFANHEVATLVKKGEVVHFEARIELPEGAGKLDYVDWSFEGEEVFSNKSSEFTQKDEVLFVQAEHTYQEAGTYFAVIRVVSNRNGKDAYTRLRNLCRVRITVSED